jgi:hypothetical protein
MGQMVKGVIFVSVISSITVTPNRIEIVARYLESLGERGLAYDELMAQLSPPVLRRASTSDDGDEIGEEPTKPAKPATETLSEMTQLGLVERFNNDGVASVRFVASKGQEIASLLERLEHILLNTETAEAADQQDFRRALAWLLAQDPESSIPVRRNVSSKIEEQCGAEVKAFDLTNESRVQNFYYWARYLGYAWYAGIGDAPTIIIPDPTAALVRHLPRLMATGQTLPLAQLVASWGKLSPVLEGGDARNEVEELMQPQLSRLNGTLSRSTSLALERLDRRGIIHLEQQADAPAIMLSVGSDPLPISHITYLRTN